MTVPELYELFIHNPIITTDSRNCPRGSIFFALKGERFDGNQYAEKALASGCNYAVIDNPAYYKGERTILVEDVLKSLQQIAQRHRKVIDIPVIAITGTNGKTTTKELLAAVLSTQYNLLYTEGNLNNHIGVPLTLLRLNHEHEMAVIEMGASHPGDIMELAEIAHPDYGIITNIGQAHMEGFGSFEKVLQTKGELYDYIRHVHGSIFIKKEDENLQSIARGINQVTYGYGDSSYASGQILESDPFLVMQWKQQGKINTIQTKLIGDYNIDNVLAAIAVGRYFKIPSARINRAIENYEPTNNRSQLLRTESNVIICDAYNANPTSMKAAIENFASFSGSPKALILGDMLELGEQAGVLHEEIIRLIRTYTFEKVFLCGKEFPLAGKDFQTFTNSGELLDYLQTHPLKGYNILLKGSRGMALEKLLTAL